MINQDVARGALLALVALLFLFQAATYPIGGLGDAGPGLFPLIVASVLFAVGVAIVIQSRFIEVLPLDFRFKNIALIVSSLVLFAFLSEFANMLVGIAVMVPVALFASDDFSIKRAAAITVVLGLIALIMKNALGVQLPLY